MWYKGNQKRCEDYNAIVSYEEAYEGLAHEIPVSVNGELALGRKTW